MTPTRLHLGASRLENLPPACLRVFLDKSWIHFGDQPGPATGLRAIVRKFRQVSRGITNPAALYEKTTFEPFYFTAGKTLPFGDGAVSFIFSEHFFEHLFLDDAMALMRECARAMKAAGVMRVVVPDADLRTYEPPEPIGYPSKRMPFTHPDKHKTRWSVYSLSEALRLVGLEPRPLRYCDKEGGFFDSKPAYSGAHDPLGNDLSYLRRPQSLIVDGVKH